MKYCVDFEKQRKECNLRGNILLTLYADLKIKCEETLTKMITWGRDEKNHVMQHGSLKMLARKFVLNVINLENGATS